MTGACASPDGAARSAATRAPLKLVVLGWSSGPSDERMTVGVVAEVTHWLQYSPGVVVRDPRPQLAERGSHAISLATRSDVDYVVWIELRREGDKLVAEWELEAATDPGSEPSGGRTPVRGALPELPRGIAEAVLGELGVEAPAATSRESRVAADATAYADFLRLLSPWSEVATLRWRIEALEGLQSSLGSYPPAATALRAP